MIKGNSAAAYAVRLEWWSSTIDHLQVGAGSVAFLHPTDSFVAVIQVGERLPSPETHIECLLLRGVLFEYACRWNTLAHVTSREPSALDCGCGLVRALQDFGSGCEDPRPAFERWIRSFVTVFARKHPPSLAIRAARIIRQEFDRATTLNALSRQLGVNPQQLGRQFRDEFGISIPAYKRAVRIVEGIRQLSTTKVDAVALAVGYKSKKNFYRAFRALTGLTPTGFRTLPAESGKTLVDTLSSHLVMPLRHPWSHP